MKKMYLILMMSLAIGSGFGQDLHITTDYSILPCDTLPRQVTITVVDSLNLCIPPFEIIVDGDIYSYYSPVTLPLDTGWHSLWIACHGGVHMREIFISCGIMSIQNPGINNDDVSVYPNPVADQITIEYSGHAENCNIFIYNTKGQLLLYQAMTQSKTELDISAFAKGIYILKLTGNEKTDVVKFVKE